RHRAKVSAQATISFTARSSTGRQQASSWMHKQCAVGPKPQKLSDALSEKDERCVVGPYVPIRPGPPAPRPGKTCPPSGGTRSHNGNMGNWYVWGGKGAGTGCAATWRVVK